MSATARNGAMGSTGSGSRKMWMLVGLLAVGALVQACSDNKGHSGPGFPAGQAGDPATGGFIDLLLQEGPGADQFIVTAFVLSGNGRPSVSRQIFLHTTAGTIVPTQGFTDGNGQFRAVLTCNGPAFVTAFSEGTETTKPACGAVATTPAATAGTGTETGTTGTGTTGTP